MNRRSLSRLRQANKMIHLLVENNRFHLTSMFTEDPCELHIYITDSQEKVGSDEGLHHLPSSKGRRRKMIDLLTWTNGSFAEALFGSIRSTQIFFIKFLNRQKMSEMTTRNNG